MAPSCPHLPLIPRLPATRLFAAAFAVSLSLAAPASAQEDDGLSGEVNVGGSLATGNTDTTRLDAEVKARFKAGRLEDNYLLSVEFADENGSTTAQRLLGSVESRYDVHDGLFVFGYLEYDDDRFSGFKYEIESAFGAGYKLIDTDDMRFLIQAGPGYRYSRGQIAGTTENQLLARGSALLEYDMSESTALTNSTIVTWDSERTKFENTFAVTSDLIGNLSSRISFNVRYNTDPPPLTKKTDTLTKVALVYDF